MKTQLKLKRKPNESMVDKAALHQVTFDILHKKLEESDFTPASMKRQICETTGLKYPWLDKFITDTGGSPSIDKLEKLYEHLSGRKLIDLL